MNIMDHLSWRYATKKFNANKLIDNEKLQTLYQSFNLTATSYGLQPIKLVVISNKELQAELVKHTMNQEQIAQASQVLVFCINTKIDKDYIVNYFERVKQIRNTPEAILKPFKDFLIQDFTEKPQQDIENWATKQAYLAMGNLLTVCAVQGIDACPMEGFEPDKYDALLELDKKELKSVLLLPIGYRAEDDIFAGFKKIRKPLKDSVFFHQQ